MKKLRIYVDTSVFGGCFDAEFEKYSKELFELFERKEAIAVVSSVVYAEVNSAPANVQAKLKSLAEIEEVDLNPEIDRLSDEYLKAEIVTRKYAADAMHIAIATYNDKKVVMITEEENEKIVSQKKKIQQEYMIEDALTNIKSEKDSEQAKQKIMEQFAYAPGEIIKVDTNFNSEGKEYDLNNKKDFETLRIQTDMSYQQGGTEMIYFQNGVKTGLKDAEKGALILEQIAGQKVGFINNTTHGLVADSVEYLPSILETKDVLTAKIYEDIAKNGDNNNLIILHSAGNEDAYKALQVLALENRSLDNKIDFISVASPRSKNDLKKATSKVNSNLFNQYNNYKDPVTWGPAGMTAGLVAPAAGVFIGIPIIFPALSVYAIPAAGVAAGLVGTAAGAAEMGGIYFNHGIDQYLNKDYNGIKTDIKLWAEQNSSTKSTK